STITGMDLCPTCHGRLADRQRAEALDALAEVLSTKGMSYPDAALIFGRSVGRIQNLVSELRLPVTYGRIGSHPRRRAFLTPQAIRALGQHLSRLQARPHQPR